MILNVCVWTVITFAKIIEFYLCIQMLPAKNVSWPHFSWTTLYWRVNNCCSGSGALDAARRKTKYWVVVSFVKSFSSESRGLLSRADDFSLNAAIEHSLSFLFPSVLYSFFPSLPHHFIPFLCFFLSFYFSFPLLFLEVIPLKVR